MKRNAQRSLRARPRAQTRRRWRRQRLRAAFEMKGVLEQSQCDAVVFSLGKLGSAIPVIHWRWYGSFAFFGCQHLDLGADFIRRQHPIHWN